MCDRILAGLIYSAGLLISVALLNIPSEPDDAGPEHAGPCGDGPCDAFVDGGCVCLDGGHFYRSCMAVHGPYDPDECEPWRVRQDGGWVTGHISIELLRLHGLR